MAKTATKTKTNNRIKGKLPAEKNGEGTLKLQPLNIGKMVLQIRGTSPLVVHNFDAKSREQMLDKQRKTQRASGKEARCPEEEFLQAIYWVEGEPPAPKLDKQTGERSYDEGVVIEALKAGKFGVPAGGFKNAVVAACRNTDMKMTQIKQAIFINGVDDPNWCIIESPGLPEMDARICRLQDAKRTPIERFRPMWKKWKMSLRVEWDRGLLSADNVVNLIEAAGFFVGICEGRPERSSLSWGRFEVVKQIDA